MSACPSTPKLFSHPGAPRLHPTTALLSPSQLHAVPMDHSILKVKPYLRNPQICNIPSPYGSTIQDQLWDLVDVAWGIPMSWVMGITPQTTETHSSFSFTPLKL